MTSLLAWLGWTVAGSLAVAAVALWVNRAGWKAAGGSDFELARSDDHRGRVR